MAVPNTNFPYEYDVFLNHRGPDVKDTFVAHLNDALCAAGFHPFLDAKSLIKGKHPYNSINEALSGVGVHVAIFSKGYAESKYCLDELHDMLESGKLILPVFYGVEVEHLCRPYDGPFAAGLRKHKKRGRHQDVERWETALAKVADLQGFRLAEFNGDEAQLKRRIVLAVQRALPARRLQQVAPHRVGLEESLKVVIKKLNLTGDSVGIIGVFGMGGIGKTTLVREVYNHFAMEKRFEEQSFLKDVRSITDPLDLQKQLVYDLLQEDLQSSEKFSYRFDRFMGRKVLIVVDDIDHRSQFDVLIPHIDKLARGSRILVTSRDQNVLTNIMRGDGHLTAMHEVELMSPHDSYRLFNWHAFYNEKASDGFQDLARKVADACCRLPLALEVIGAFLFDKKRPEDRDCWHQATETLRANGDILNKLKISYDGLSSDESRLMFTDIACFLIGKDEQMAMQIFESCISYTGPQVSFHALMDKSLVTLDSDRRIRMHDLLRDMGRNVVTKQSQIEGQRSHLWDPAMAERVLRKNQGTDTVRGLSVAGAKDGATWKAETYTRMSELHFLILDHCQVKGDFSTWSKELRWLQWWSMPLSELPPTLSLLNLSVLDFTGSKSFPCKELRMLILKDCTALQELPQTIGKLSRLKNLDVQGCSTLKALPDSVGELVELTQLNLSNCTTLERLPDTICLLSKLEKLWLINCTKLKFLPTEFGKLQRLDEFWADATSLSRLPHSFSQLSNLEDLHLRKCEKIQELPSMSGLFPCKELRMLILKDCTALQELPQTIGKLSRLKNLDVQGCSTLKALPDSVGELVELTQLNLSNCTTLERLPDTICLLSKLEKLWLINCTKLKFLPTEFGKLQRLDEFWADATSLSRLPHSFSQLSNLEDLHLRKCEKIQELPSMSGLVKLKLFHMGHIGVQTLPEDFGHLQNLVELHLSGCKNLQTLPQSFGLLQLQRLQMNDNPQLEMLPEGFGRPKKRKHDSLFIKLKASSGRFKEPNVDVPSTSLELGTKSLKNVENTISAQSSDSVLINQLQCDYLFHKLRESLNDAKACIDGLSPQDIQRSCCILESLAQTWKEGEILVGDCCDAQWIRVAMILANAKEHFTCLIFKLRLYVQLFQSIFKEGATKEFLIKLQDRKWSDDVKDEEFPIIDEKALEDQQWLLSRLMEVGSIDSENLIKRLNHPGKIDAWKVAHKSIQRVPHGQIGRGASATVHKVEWLGKQFAEKCFFGPQGEHFQKEASLLAGLSHPNILPLFCLVTTANSCSLVTELMDGDLLGLMCKRLDNHEIQGAPFKLLEAIDIMLQVAEGMHYLHQKKVVHRHLKSKNILVKCDEHDGHVYAKVADFGLSKTKESSCTYSNLTMDQGTTRWMAPELFGNVDQSVPIQVCQETQHPSLSNEQISRRYPFKVDIYSFGMVCYEILTGNVPFHNIISVTELRTKIKDGLRPDLPEQCPHQLSKLIQECYHPDPATRPSFFEICLELRHIMCSLMIGCTL
ncbi:unnamed protein product [Sphagnum troendelagicum]